MKRHDTEGSALLARLTIGTAISLICAMAVACGAASSGETTSDPAKWNHDGTSRAVQPIVPAHGEMFAALPPLLLPDALCSAIPQDQWGKVLGGSATVAVTQNSGCRIESKDRWTVYLGVDGSEGIGDPVEVGGVNGNLDNDDVVKRTTLTVPISERLTTADLTGYSISPYLTVKVEPWTSSAGDPKAVAQKVGAELLKAIGSTPELPQAKYGGDIPVEKTAPPLPGHPTSEYPLPVMSWQMCNALTDTLKAKPSSTKAYTDGSCSWKDDHVDLKYLSVDKFRPPPMTTTIAGHKASVSSREVVVQTTDAGDQFLELSSMGPLLSRDTHGKFKSGKALAEALIPKLLPK